MKIFEYRVKICTLLRFLKFISHTLIYTLAFENRPLYVVSKIVKEPFFRKWRNLRTVVRQPDPSGGAALKGSFTYLFLNINQNSPKDGSIAADLFVCFLLGQKPIPRLIVIFGKSPLALLLQEYVPPSLFPDLSW